MKILFIITQSELGGAQRWVFDTATQLREKKCEITVAAGPYWTYKSNRNDWSYPLLEKLSRHQIKTHFLHHLIREINPVKDFLALLEIYRLIKQEQPDILQLCSAKAGLLGSLAAKIYNKLSVQYLDDRQDIVSKCRIIYRIGGWVFNDPRPQWQKKLFFWLEKLTAPLKDKIIVNSRHDYEQALRLGIAGKGKLVLLYNGVNINTINNISEKSEINSKFKIQNSKFVIGSIANFYPTKGLSFLIKAAALMRKDSQPPTSNFQLLIVGDGPQRPLLEKLIKKHGVENIVKLVGQKDNPWKYFRSLANARDDERNEAGIDIFVIPSVKEGMPYVLLEAMAAGLPIVATEVGGIPEIIEDGTSGLIVPSANSEKLTEAINLLIHDRELRDQLGKNARRRVRDFSLEGMIREYEELINNLI